MKLALVTGGHRRVGAVIAARLARAGYALALHASREATLDPALAAVLNDCATSHQVFIRDFTDPDSAIDLVETATAHFGAVPDLLVNNASLFGQDRLETVTADALLAHYAVNCAAPALLTRAFAAAGGSGRAIVNILDQRLAHPHPDQASYTLSKSALAALTAVSARTYPALRVNAVAPGFTLATDEYPGALIAALPEKMPLARLPTPIDIAKAVAFLAGAGGVTGQTLFVDGGAHLVPFERDFLYLPA